MKVYRVTISDSQEGTCLGWAATKKAAYDLAKDMSIDFDGATYTVDRVDLGNSAQSAASWLSAHVTRDNG